MSEQRCGTCRWLGEQVEDLSLHPCDWPTPKLDLPWHYFYPNTHHVKADDGANCPTYEAKP